MNIPPSVRCLLHDFELPLEPVGAVWERAITERVMARGTLDAMRWLIGAFSREQLAGYLAERGRRVLDPREVRFWTTICHIPAAQAQAWVAASRARTWHG